MGALLKNSRYGFALSCLLIALSLVPSNAPGSGTIPVAIQLPPGPLIVAAGTSYQLSWAPPGPGEFFLLSSTPTSSGAVALPNFSSTGISFACETSGSSGCTLTNASYNSTYGLWSTTANLATLTIPSGAAVGTAYAIQLYTCNANSDECSNSSGATGPTDSQTTIVVGQATRLFTNSNVSNASSNVYVQPGTNVGLHWATPQPAVSGEFYLLSNTSSSTSSPLPNFSSSSGIVFPCEPDTSPCQENGSYNSTYQLWGTTANSVEVVIPSNASAETTYQFQLYTCNSTTNVCSNTSGATTGPPDSVVTLTVAGNWSSVLYSQNYMTPHRIAAPACSSSCPQFGHPLDAAIDGSDNIWSSAEFSQYVLEATSSNSFSDVAVVDSAASGTPFTQCLFYTSNGGCAATGVSEAGERVIFANGLIWFTQGGWSFPSAAASGVTNLSRVVAVDPQTGTMCTYDIPGNDNEIVGIAATGTGSSTTIWLADSEGDAGPIDSQESSAYLDSFQPSSLGSGCSTNVTYSQSAMAGKLASGQPIFQQQALPKAPAQIAVDPTSNILWLSDFFGNEIDEFNVGSSTLTRFPLSAPNQNPVVGTWQIVADSGYVYAADYADNHLIRLNKSTSAIDYVPVPVTSDTEQIYGLVISNGNLYFTLSNDGQPTSFGASTFGYINITAWEAASSKCASGTDCVPAPTPGQAFVYSGLDCEVDPTSPAGNGDPGCEQGADFRGLAIGSAGDIAIADLNQILRLTPNN
jgi:streptogramin lyase